MYSFKKAQNIKKQLERFIGKPIDVKGSLLIDRISIVDFANQEVEINELDDKELAILKFFR